MKLSELRPAEAHRMLYHRVDHTAGMKQTWKNSASLHRTDVAFVRVFCGPTIK
jgi:hypothetical protein